MCEIWRITERAEISPQQLQDMLPDIERLEVEQVVFSGGEPLLHSDLGALARPLRALGIRLTLLTTGLLLERHAELAAECFDEVIVSLDGPPEVHDRVRRVPEAFGLLERGVRALGGRVPTAGRCTVQSENAGALRATVATARRLGLESISFLAADLSSEAFHRPGGWTAEKQAEVSGGPAALAVLEREVEALIVEEAASIEAGFIRESPEKLRRIAGRFREALGLAQPQAPRCNAPWVSAVVETDGALRPCFFHAEVGNVLAGGLAGGVNGARAEEFRSRLDVAEDPTCRRCVCSLYRA